MAVNRIFILAGEASGDVLGAELVRSLRRIQPQLHIDAWGGTELSRALNKPVLRNLDQLAFMGFWDVLRNARAVQANFAAARAVLSEPWDLVVLIDYPGFNLRLAKWMATRPWRSQRRVVQLVAPSVWAWKEGRVEILKAAFDAVVPLLPFEPKFLTKRGVNAPYFGHPALDRFALGSATESGVLVLAPGSRKAELQRLAPVFAATADRLGMKPRWIRPSSWSEGAYRAMLREALQAEPHGELAEGMASARGARAALVASGTATLELALLKVPMVVAYRVDALSFALAKRLVKVKHVSLVNLVLGREAVSERLQGQCEPEVLANDLSTLMADGPRRTAMFEDFEVFAKALGEPGAMDRTAAYLLQE
jgi:lipid-A-disaccharide synthase